MPGRNSLICLAAAVICCSFLVRAFLVPKEATAPTQKQTLGAFKNKKVLGVVIGRACSATREAYEMSFLAERLYGRLMRNDRHNRYIAHLGCNRRKVRPPPREDEFSRRFYHPLPRKINRLTATCVSAKRLVRFGNLGAMPADQPNALEAEAP